MGICEGCNHIYAGHCEITDLEIVNSIPTLLCEKLYGKLEEALRQLEDECDILQCAECRSEGNCHIQVSKNILKEVLGNGNV